MSSRPVELSNTTLVGDDLTRPFHDAHPSPLARL
jgi:hypothetical protein